jgi:hypothetical protein
VPCTGGHSSAYKNCTLSREPEVTHAVQLFSEAIKPFRVLLCLQRALAALRGVPKQLVNRFASFFPYGRSLSNHFLRIPVFSDSEKYWLTGTIISRPRREFYPADDGRHSSVYFRDQLVGFAGDNRAGPQGLGGLLPGFYAPILRGVVLGNHFPVPFP